MSKRIYEKEYQEYKKTVDDSYMDLVLRTTQEIENIRLLIDEKDLEIENIKKEHEESQAIKDKLMEEEIFILMSQKEETSIFIHSTIILHSISAI